VTDATRIEAAKPTIDAILAQGIAYLMSHLGRPRCRKILIEAYFEQLQQFWEFSEVCF
jgi:3-phosphoglycerate kinase